MYNPFTRRLIWLQRFDTYNSNTIFNNDQKSYAVCNVKAFSVKWNTILVQIELNYSIKLVWHLGITFETVFHSGVYMASIIGKEALDIANSVDPDPLPRGVWSGCTLFVFVESVPPNDLDQVASSHAMLTTSLKILYHRPDCIGILISISCQIYIRRLYIITVNTPWFVVFYSLWNDPNCYIR